MSSTRLEAAFDRGSLASLPASLEDLIRDYSIQVGGESNGRTIYHLSRKPPFDASSAAASSSDTSSLVIQDDTLRHLLQVAAVITSVSPTVSTPFSSLTGNADFQSFAKEVCRLSASFAEGTLIVEEEGLAGALEKPANPFIIQDSPLSSFITLLSTTDKPKQKELFIKAFSSLSREDQMQLARAFYEKACREEDRKAIIQSQNPAVFSALEKSDPSIKESLRAALYSTLLPSLVLTDEDILSFAKEHLYERLEVLQEVMNEFFFSRAVELLPSEVRSDLNEKLKQQARATGIVIKDRDRDWGLHHIAWGLAHLEDRSEAKDLLLTHLTSALCNPDKEQRQRELHRARDTLLASCSEETLALLFPQCPILAPLYRGERAVLTEPQIADLDFRAKTLEALRLLRNDFLVKYPALAEAFSSSEHPLCGLWKGCAYFLILHPTAYDDGALTAFQNRARTLLEGIATLLEEPHADKEVLLLLETHLRQQALYPNRELFADFLVLQDLKKRFLEQALTGNLTRFGGPCYKDIYTIAFPPGREGVAGKYKPNPPATIKKEVLGYDYDSIAGFSMTAPSTISAISLKSGLCLIKNHFLQVDTLLRNADKRREEGALLLEKSCREQAEDLHNEAIRLCSLLPPSVLQQLYCFLQTILTIEGREAVGHDMWWDINGLLVADKYRARAIGIYLESIAYHNFALSNPFERKDYIGGSIQKWIQEPGRRAYDLLLEDPTAGEKFKSIPKAIVHLYCLLGIIKGSKDCSSGNSMILLSPEGEFEKLLDYDDEQSMPTINHFSHVRMWQFGLPQAAMPFDCSTMLILSNPQLLTKIRGYNQFTKSIDVSSGTFMALEQRMATIQRLFAEELTKREISLTPMELFFQVFGGKTEYTHWHSNRGCNPIHIFEFKLGNIGKNRYYSTSDNRPFLNENFEDLYESTELQRIRARELRPFKLEVHK